MGLTRLATLAVPQPCNLSFTIRLSINIQQLFRLSLPQLLLWTFNRTVRSSVHTVITITRFWG